MEGANIMTAMDSKQSESYRWLLGRGAELLEKGNRLTALKMFEKAYKLDSTAECRSYLGMLTATERGLVKKGIGLCQKAIQDDPENPITHFNYGRLLYSVERKSESLSVIMKARKIRHVDEVETWLSRVGKRRPPVFSFLTRGNPINKYSGMMLKRIGLR